MDAPINILKLLDIPRAYILWIDPVSQRWVREEITSDAYKKLATTHFPDKPIGFNGSQKEWEIMWDANKVKAIDGRPIDGGTNAGDAIVKDDGSMQIFLGDLDNEDSLSVPKDDYSGTPDKLTINKEIPIVGVTVENGVLKGI